MSIEKQLNIEYPIFWSDFAIEKDFACLLVQKIIAKRPKVIVELGAGVGTIIIAKAIKKLNLECEVYSIDADEFVNRDLKNVLIAEGVYNSKKHHLIQAPIKDVEIEDVIYKYYDYDVLIKMADEINLIDLITVDGPIGASCKNARYPALSFFENKFNDNMVVLLDDSAREDEKEIAQLWQKKYNFRKMWYHNTDRGVFELGR